MQSLDTSTASSPLMDTERSLAMLLGLQVCGTISVKSTLAVVSNAWSFLVFEHRQDGDFILRYFVSSSLFFVRILRLQVKRAVHHCLLRRTNTSIGWSRTSSQEDCSCCSRKIPSRKRKERAERRVHVRQHRVSRSAFMVFSFFCSKPGRAEERTKICATLLSATW